jgi:hypothetical protein
LTHTRHQAKRARITDRQVSRDPRNRPVKPAHHQIKAPQVENGPANIQKEVQANRLSIGLQTSTISVTNHLQGNQERADSGRVGASSSPQRSRKYHEIVQSLIDEHELLSEENSQLQQRLTSTSDQLRASEEGKYSQEAEILRLKSEVEGLQATERSLHDELKKKGDELKEKCDELKRFKSTIRSSITSSVGSSLVQVLDPEE